jgi:hypothetical protein
VTHPLDEEEIVRLRAQLAEARQLIGVLEDANERLGAALTRERHAAGVPISPGRASVEPCGCWSEQIGAGLSRRVVCAEHADRDVPPTAAGEPGSGASAEARPFNQPTESVS